MEVLLERLKMLVHLLEHVHVRMDVGAQLLDLTLLSYDHLDSLLLGL